MPDEAKGTSAASAKAFVRHWIETLNYAGPAADPKPVRRLSSEKCSACSAIFDFIDEVAAQGGSIAGEGWGVTSIDVVSQSAGSAVVIDAVVNVRPQTVQTSTASEATTFPGGRRTKTFWLERSAGSWQVVRLDQPQ
jgi:hypothetical protein